MIYEESCGGCNGDLVIVQEQHGLVIWCIGCGIRMEQAAAVGLMNELESSPAR